MKRKIVFSVMILAAMILAAGVNMVLAGELAEATFVVRWFDVGVIALEGRSGVIEVEKGWRGRKEINRVVYDPQMISLKIIEKLLKKSGTYVSTLEKPGGHQQ